MWNILRTIHSNKTLMYHWKIKRDQTNIRYLKIQCTLYMWKHEILVFTNRFNKCILFRPIVFLTPQKGLDGLNVIYYVNKYIGNVTNMDPRVRYIEHSTYVDYRDSLGTELTQSTSYDPFCIGKPTRQTYVFFEIYIDWGTCRGLAVWTFEWQHC